jgi:hypothetical protein
MSVIVHRCGCGHIDMSHAEVHGRCSYGYCFCVKNRGQVGGPSILLPSFAGLGEPVTSVTAPGAIFGSTLGGISKTCACPSCVSLFAEQAAS